MKKMEEGVKNMKRRRIIIPVLITLLLPITLISVTEAETRWTWASTMKVWI